MTEADADEPERSEGAPEDSPPPDDAAGTRPESSAAPDGNADAGPNFDDQSARSAAAADFGNYIGDRPGVVFVNSTVYADNVTGRSTAHKARKPERKPVPVSLVAAAELSRLRDVTVRSDDLDPAADDLAREGVAIVPGPPGSGKHTGGIAMFGPTAAVLEIDPTVGLDALLNFTEQIRRDGISCYLIDSLSPETARVLSGFVVRELAAQVKRASARLVVTVDSRIPLDPSVQPYAVRWTTRPDPMRALAKHLTHYLGATDAETVLNALPLDDLRVHLDTRDLQTVDQVAKAVTRAKQRGGDVTVAVQEQGFDAHRQVEEWFAKGAEPGSPDSGRTSSEIAWLVVCAVLGGCSYRSVARHAKRLTAIVDELAGLEPETGRSTLLRTRSTRLKDVQANLDTGFLQTEFGISLTETVAPCSGARIRAVLDVVWHEYELIAEGMLQWLCEAGADHQEVVRRKAAFAAGYLAEHDFAEIRGRLVLPWAKESPLTRRTAAYALGVPAASDRSRPLVLALLRHWASLDNQEMVWAAVEAYGTFVGLVVPPVAMFELLMVADRGQAPPERVAASARTLFMLGTARSSGVPLTVLSGLRTWMATEPLGEELAVLTFLGLWSTASDQQRWDAATVWAALADDSAVPYTAALLARCLDHQASRPEALTGLLRLVRASSTSPEVIGPLGRVLSAAVDHGRSPARAADRLRHYLDGWKATEPRLGAVVDTLLPTLDTKES